MNRTLARFMGCVSPEPMSGCWLWAGPMSSSGYGTFWSNNKNERAHRFAWIALRSPIPKGMFVCHRCDNPACVNPDHLFLGTHQDNVEDMVSKGRSGTGERNSNARLTSDQVAEIRAASGPQKPLADRYGISVRQVRHIKSGQRWGAPLRFLASGLGLVLGEKP